MKTQIIRVHTGRRDTVHDITGQCADFAREAAAGGDGLLHVFVPHATAGIAVLERWQHAHGSRGHGRSHVLPAFVAPFTILPVVAGRLELGTWQSVALVDLNVDNPDRQVRLSLIE
jgi:thiamine phosphate synthase YjbQ (UPF0047 family)